VSWPEEVRESDWGKTGNKKLHSWAFDRITSTSRTKAIRGVEVLKENEWNTSKTCSACGDTTKSNRVERGLYVCSSCGLVGNADCNGAENMRQEDNSESSRSRHRSQRVSVRSQPNLRLSTSYWARLTMAYTMTRLFESLCSRTCGRFQMMISKLSQRQLTGSSRNKSLNEAVTVTLPV